MSKTLQIKIGPDHAAATDDALGRERTGYYPGITPAEAWERGRAEWSLDPSRAFDAATVEIIATDDDLVLAVAVITGINRTKPGKYALTGELIDDARVGRTSSHRHPSRNRINYY